MKKVLITGASGFIGRHCLPFLAQRADKVVAVARHEVQLPAEVQFSQLDLLDPAAVSSFLKREQPTHLLHFAWIATPKVYWTSTVNLNWVEASLHLVQEFVRHGGRRVVVAGTCAEYDWCYGFCSEKVTPCAPSTLYGTCKHALQSMLTSYANEVGVSSAWGRIFFLYGPHEHPDRLVSSVIRSLLRGESARCTKGDQFRDFLEVSDVAAAFVHLLAGDVEGPVNIGSGNPIAVKEVVRTIGHLIGREELIQLGALPEPTAGPPLLVADSRKLQQEVGWTPQRELEDGLVRTIAWWREHGNPDGGIKP